MRGDGERNLEGPGDMREVLLESAAALRRLAEHHERLLRVAMHDPALELAKEACGTPQCPCRAVFRETLNETIGVLDATRSTFKSKQLAQLRRKLILTLAQHG